MADLRNQIFLFSTKLHPECISHTSEWCHNIRLNSFYSREHKCRSNIIILGDASSTGILPVSVLSTSQKSCDYIQTHTPNITWHFFPVWTDTSGQSSHEPQIRLERQNIDLFLCSFSVTWSRIIQHRCQPQISATLSKAKCLFFCNYSPY